MFDRRLLVARCLYHLHHRKSICGKLSLIPSYFHYLYPVYIQGRHPLDMSSGKRWELFAVQQVESEFTSRDLPAPALVQSSISRCRSFDSCCRDGILGSWPMATHNRWDFHNFYLASLILTSLSGTCVAFTT